MRTSWSPLRVRAARAFLAISLAYCSGAAAETGDGEDPPGLAELSAEVAPESLPDWGVLAFALVPVAGGEEDVDTRLLHDRGVRRFAGVTTLVEPEERPEHDGRQLADEYVLAPTLGVGVYSSALLSLSFEARNLNELIEGQWATSTLHVGPNLTLHIAGWRSMLGYLPEVVSWRDKDVQRQLPSPSDAPRHAARLAVATSF